MIHMVANLKAHQNLTEANTWINTFINIVRNHKHIKESMSQGKLQIVLAPSEAFLLLYRTASHEFQGVSLAAQDVSVYERGSYTGETGAYALSGFIAYSLVGHSERHKYFGETREAVEKKLVSLSHHNIEPILCVRSLEDMVSFERGMIAYEPPDAIGSGHNYPLEEVLEFKKTLQLPDETPFLYGGSVDEQNVGLYLQSPEIDGFLVGGASLDAARFCEIASQV